MPRNLAFVCIAHSSHSLSRSLLDGSGGGRGVTDPLALDLPCVQTSSYGFDQILKHPVSTGTLPPGLTNADTDTLAPQLLLGGGTDAPQHLHLWQDAPRWPTDASCFAHLQVSGAAPWGDRSQSHREKCRSWCVCKRCSFPPVIS